jgi:hypothetical protein
MSSRFVAELFNSVDNVDLADRRALERDRRQSVGRRSEDLSTCAIHDEAMKRRDERCEERKQQRDKDMEVQGKINSEFFVKIDNISTKLNWILGAAFILWPLVQVLIQYLIKK